MYLVVRDYHFNLTVTLVIGTTTGRKIGIVWVRVLRLLLPFPHCWYTFTLTLSPWWFFRIGVITQGLGNCMLRTCMIDGASRPRSRRPCRAYCKNVSVVNTLLKGTKNLDSRLLAGIASSADEIVIRGLMNPLWRPNQFDGP